MSPTFSLFKLFFSCECLLVVLGWLRRYAGTSPVSGGIPFFWWESLSNDIKVASR